MVWPLPVIPRLNSGLLVVGRLHLGRLVAGLGEVRHALLLVGGWVADANLVIIIGWIATLAAATAGAPPANRDPLASVSAPAVARYLCVRRGKIASRSPVERGTRRPATKAATATVAAVTGRCDNGAPA